jgi:oxygen-independent coproporphyrinogen-3 oxidase
MAHRANADNFAAELSRLDDLARDGLIQRSGNEIIVPESARPFIRTVCAVFDAYLSSDKGRYSRAS